VTLANLACSEFDSRQDKEVFLFPKTSKSVLEAANLYAMVLAVISRDKAART
jgi:hypothetical protein